MFLIAWDHQGDHNSPAHAQYGLPRCACRWPHIVPRFRKVGFKRRNLQEEILQNRAVSVNDLAHVLTWVDYVRFLVARWLLLSIVPV